MFKDHVSPNKPLSDVKEAEAHSKVFLAMIKDPQAINEKTLFDWHSQLFKETKPDLAGKYCDYLVRVSTYVAKDCQDIPKLMKALIKFSKTKTHPVELAARIHYRFERIHPFGDGNGRIGRLLLNQILWGHGYPMLIIEKKKCQSYYKAFTRGEEGFVKYLYRRYVEAHKG